MGETTLETIRTIKTCPVEAHPQLQDCFRAWLNTQSFCPTSSAVLITPLIHIKVYQHILVHDDLPRRTSTTLVIIIIYNPLPFSAG